MEDTSETSQIGLNPINENRGYDNPIPVSDTLQPSGNDDGSSGSNPNTNGESSQVPNGIETDQNNRTLDVNSYATRKTFAQGMLDMSLLAANASQLKFLLTLGTEHEFYGILLALIIISFVLQAAQVVIYFILGVIFNINNVDQQRSAEIINNICVSIVVLTVIVNVVITAFDIRTIDILSSRIKID